MCSSLLIGLSVLSDWQCLRQAFVVVSCSLYKQSRRMRSVWFCLWKQLPCANQSAIYNWLSTLKMNLLTHRVFASSPPGHILVKRNWISERFLWTLLRLCFSWSLNEISLSKQLICPYKNSIMLGDDEPMNSKRQCLCYLLHYIHCGEGRNIPDFALILIICICVGLLRSSKKGIW